MGNCGFRGLQVEDGDDDDDDMVRVVTSNGGVMELSAPVTAECITNEFPGHALFRSPPDDLFSQPLLHSEELLPGKPYYLHPLCLGTNSTSHFPTGKLHQQSCSSLATATTTPYRMSFDSQGKLKKSFSEYSEVFPRYNNSRRGVWKVKLVISPDQLSEILSQEARTEELIESVRTVAKCGSSVSSSLANSDSWSMSSGNLWRASLDKFGADI